MICKHGRHEIDCDYCMTSVCWAIVRDARGMRETGHGRTVEWARAVLGLENQSEIRRSRHTGDTEHDVNVR